MASSFYNANPLLKSVGVNVQYTPEQLDEYVKCAQDPIHFINTHIKIISLDKGLILFKLFDYQEKFIRAIHENRFVISLMPRQSGKCLQLDTKVKLKQKSTGKLVEITLGEFYVWKRATSSIEELQKVRGVIYPQLADSEIV